MTLPYRSEEKSSHSVTWQPRVGTQRARLQLPHTEVFQIPNICQTMGGEYGLLLFLLSHKKSITTMEGDM